MIGKEQSKFKIALDKIKTFLFNANQNKELKKLLTKSLSDLKGHKNPLKENQSILFLLDNNLKLKDIQFVGVPTKSNFKLDELDFTGENDTSESIVDWSFFNNISEEDYYITISNIIDFRPIMEAVVSDEITSDIEAEIQLFFNFELKRFIDQLDTYFTGSYLRRWAGYCEFTFYPEESERIYNSQLFFSSNFLSSKDVRKIYEWLQSSGFLAERLSTIKRESEKENQFESISSYLLWEKFNPEFKKVKWEIFEDNFVVKTFPPFWSDEDFIKLFSDWTKTLSSETNTEKVKDCYINLSSNKVVKTVEFFINKFFHQDSTRELVLKFVSTLIRFILTSSTETCGADYYSSIDEDDCDEFTDFILKLFRNKEWSLPLLEQFQEGESMNVLINDEKYLNLSYSNETFPEILRKLIEERNVKMNVTLEDINSIYSTVSYERDNLSFIVGDVYLLWTQFEDNVTVIVSEKDYQTLSFYKQGLEGEFLDEDWYSNVEEILEVIDSYKNI